MTRSPRMSYSRPCRPDSFVDEANLTQHISVLRKALGETPQDRRFIVTVPGRGYRFVAPVREVSTATSTHLSLRPLCRTSQLQ